MKKLFYKIITKRNQKKYDAHEQTRVYQGKVKTKLHDVKTRRK